MKSWRWNGTAFEPCDSVPIEDRGFRYGMAVFESLRVSEKGPLFFAEHIRRIQQACQDREFHVDTAALRECGALLRQPGLEGFARIYVTAGDGTVAAPADDCRMYVLLEDRPRPTVSAYDLAMPLEMHQPLFGGIKTANYWANIDVLQRALRRGKHEALLFNEHAELVSACMANVFVVHNGAIRTPALACGARDGVVREWILNQTPVKQGSLFIEDLQTAEEIFVSNSWIGIVPVAKVEDRTLPSRIAAERLVAAYARAIADRAS